MFEENYSYSVFATKLSRSKGWVSKWTRHWKTNLAEFLQSQSRWRLTNKTALNLTTQIIICKSKYGRGHSPRKFERSLKGKQLSGSPESIRRFLRNKLKWRCFRQQKVPLINCRVQKARFWNSWRSVSLNTLQNLIGSVRDGLKAVIRNKGDAVP